MDPRKALRQVQHRERHKILVAALEAAAEDDAVVGELVDALAGQFSQFGRQSALELLAKIAWKILECERDR